MTSSLSELTSNFLPEFYSHRYDGVVDDDLFDDGRGLLRFALMFFIKQLLVAGQSRAQRLCFQQRIPPFVGVDKNFELIS